MIFYDTLIKIYVCDYSIIFVYTLSSSTDISDSNIATGGEIYS